MRHRARRGIRRGIAVLGILGLLLLEALPLHAAPASGWHALFPSPAAYPPGSRLLPLYLARSTANLVDPGTATQVRRFHFVAGGVQDSDLPGQRVASVTVLAFASARDAAAFLAAYRPSALQHPGTPGTHIAQFGAGARYVMGGCANCGPSGPKIGLLLLQRASVAVQIEVQPPDPALALRLGRFVHSVHLAP